MARVSHVPLLYRTEVAAVLSSIGGMLPLVIGRAAQLFFFFYRLLCSCMVLAQGSSKKPLAALSVRKPQLYIIVAADACYIIVPSHPSDPSTNNCQRCTVVISSIRMYTRRDQNNYSSVCDKPGFWPLKPRSVSHCSLRCAFTVNNSPGRSDIQLTRTHLFISRPLCTAIFTMIGLYEATGWKK